MSDTNDITLQQFQELIFRRYFQTDSKRGSAKTFLWFMEEIGELSSALANAERGKGDRDNLQEEFADVLAWLCTLANINDVDLTAAIDKYCVGPGPEGTKS